MCLKSLQENKRHYLELDQRGKKHSFEQKEPKPWHKNTLTGFDLKVQSVSEHGEKTWAAHVGLTSLTTSHGAHEGRQTYSI